MPPQRRKPGPGGPPRRRPKVAGASRARQVTPDEQSEPVDLDKRPQPVEEKQPTAETEPAETEPAETEPAETEPAETSAGPATPTAQAESSKAETGRGSRGWAPVAAVGAVAVVLAAVAVVAAFRPGADVSNRAWVDGAATREVTEAAQYAIETMHGYNFETIDEDFARIRELLDEDRREEFDSTADVTKQAAVQTRTVTEVDVLHIGTSMLDETRAEVSAYINVSATGEGIAQGSAAAPLLVRMEKSNGKWLVAEIRDQ